MEPLPAVVEKRKSEAERESREEGEATQMGQVRFSISVLVSSFTIKKEAAQIGQVRPSSLCPLQSPLSIHTLILNSKMIPFKEKQAMCYLLNHSSSSSI